MILLPLELPESNRLRVFANDRDLLRDMFVYLDYARERSIKRMARTNEIPRADSVRIAKLFGDPELVQAAQETGGTQWLDFIDLLAYRLHLVNYDRKGEYRGYSSSEPSFIENFIIVDIARVEKFLNLSAAEQEKQILAVLINAKSQDSYDDHSNNEFFQHSVLGELDHFTTRGSAVGLMPTLKFPEIRNFLLEILVNCVPGQWYGTADLISYLKNHHPFFLIPQNAPTVDRWGKPIGRYENFYEGKDYWATDVGTVPPNADDAFERVEGRYIERFLEYIPLVMRFVDVAYDPEPYTGLRPSRGFLKAFRVNQRFLRLMQGQGTAPKVTIQPNFDVVVESDFFPAAVIRQLAALGELVSSPNSGHGAYVGIYQLKKTAVAAAQVSQPDLDVTALLKELSGRDLPPNVQIELDEWAGHADQFTLYEGFALLEMDNVPLNVEKFSTEKIAPNLRLVRDPEKVFTTLEILGQVPVRIQHSVAEFTLLPESVTSLFPKETVLIQSQKTATSLKLSRAVTISYQFPDDEAFSAAQKALAELRCPFHSDTKTRIISIQQKEQARFDEALLSLVDDYTFEIE